MNRVKSIKSTKYFILGIVFLATAVITFISMNFDMVQPASTSMAGASLPTVSMKTEAGSEFNRLHGYTTQINQALINESITPISQNRKLSVVIHTYGQDIMSVSYKIRSLSDNSLIENTQVSGYSETDGNIDVTFNIKNLIDDNTEYALDIILETDVYSEIHYYTRIISGENYQLESKFDFVKDFNDCTFDPGRLKDIQKYLETSSSGSNNNYGKVNINSSLDSVGWGELSPYKESELIPIVKEINQDVAVICFDYKIGAANNYDSYDSYNVFEYYRIRQTPNGFYLLNFEREVNQVFDGKNDLASTSKINLGVNSDTTAIYASDEKGVYSYFVNQGSLWCFNTDNNMYTKVFSFESDDSDGIRENYGSHNIKIMNIEDNGDCSFLVYGYMNRGKHEGDVGVSLCNYSYTDNNVVEKLYLPVNIPYEILSRNVGEVAYLAGENIFYILMDDTLYSVDLVSKEVMVEVTGLVEGTYAVSESGSVIAYSTNGKLYETDTIRIFNMANNTDHELKAGEGDYLRALGYVNEDFIYGTAHKDDIYVEDAGSVTFAMYKIGILSSDYNLIKEYNEPDIYVSDASVADMRINLTRIVKSEDGGYEGVSIDQLINKDENNEELGLTLETIVTDNRKQELCIKFVKPCAGMQVNYRTSSDVQFKSDADLKLDNEFTGEGKYYVYGYGKFQGSKTDVSSAITLANNTYGSVTDYNANIIWKRYKNTTGSIEGLSSPGCNTEDSLKKSVQIIADYAGAQFSTENAMNAGDTAKEALSRIPGVEGICIKGVSVDKMLNFIDAGCPVIGRTGNNSYVIIIAYDSKQLVYMDTSSGRTITTTITDANKLFAQWENIFVTYYKN
ncbi:MAG: hypothetical protein Q4F06_07500 [Eubacteriales bacterium]|nr:hypothetical protein [Eubacteriales bacterium]